MTNFLILIVIGLMVYMLSENKKTEKKQKKSISYRELLPQYLHKNCEIILKKPLVSLDAMYSVRGVLADVDDEWVMVERNDKKKKTTKVFRISQISGIKEIVDLQ